MNRMARNRHVNRMEERRWEMGRKKVGGRNLGRKKGRA